MTGGRSSLRHVALAPGRAEQDAAIAWLAARGCAPRVRRFHRIGWRGVFVTDPEGDTVELVARDPGPGPGS